MLAAVEQLERGQALHHVEEMRAEETHLAELPPRQRPRRHADQRHEKRDQRRGDQQHDEGQQIERQDDQQDQQRHQQRREEAGQVIAEIGVQLFDAFGRRQDQFAAALVRV